MWTTLFSPEGEMQDVTLLACQSKDCPACGRGGAAKRAAIEQARAARAAQDKIFNNMVYRGECNHCGEIKGYSQFHPRDWAALEDNYTAAAGGQMVSGTDRKAVRPFNHATPRGMCKDCYDKDIYWR